MHLPNYKDGSIVNLMSSIESALGGRPRYKPLKILPPSELLKSKNIVLLVIDGLGYEYLVGHKKDTVFDKFKISKITSVFPSDTASAVATFMTGTASQQHAISGWFMYLKELDLVSVVLPFIQKDNKTPLSRLIDPKKIFDQKSFFEKIKVQSYIVASKKIINSDFTLTLSKRAKRFSYNNRLSDFFAQIEKTIRLNNCRKYIYAYWPQFDILAHKYGIKSKQANKHLKKISAKLTGFLESVKDVTVIITADHGLIDAAESKLINLADHPKLEKTLTFPLCGDFRLIYCYVHPSKREDFEKYVREHFKNICDFYKSKELIKKNYFGLFKPNKKLFDRVGDYTLVMKDNYVIKDFISGEKLHFEIGNHGGISKEEIFVPLVVVNK